MCDTQDGWQKDEETGAWYYYEDGEVATGWKDINGSTYYFNKPGGSMGWSKEVDGKYLGSDGRQVKDERWVNTEEDNSGTWYYVGANERTVIGWNKVGDDFHYFNKPGGSMTYQNTIDGFNIDNDGKIESGTGWLKDGYSGDWYHYSDGQMSKGWEQEGDNWYYLKDDGKMATGWEQVGGDWYYFHSDGTMATGWINDGNGWYYLYSNGTMTWDNTIDGYHLESSGKMVTGTGWQYIDGSWYYLKDDGTVATNWQCINDNWYYLYPEGSMAWNTTVDGYYLNKDGAWVPNANNKEDDSNNKEIEILKNKGLNGDYWNEYNTNGYGVGPNSNYFSDYLYDVKVSDEYEHYILTCDRDAGETPMSIEDYVNTMGPKWEYIYNHKTQADRNSELAENIMMSFALADPVIAAGESPALAGIEKNTSRLTNEYEANAEKTASASEKELSGKTFGTDHFNEQFKLDPVNAVTGSLYIPATDIVLPDIHEEFKIERKYQSINTRLGLFGIGWTNNFETQLNIWDEKINVLCNDGHIETFNKINESWVNRKGGAQKYLLCEEKEYWRLKSSWDKKTYRYDKLGKLIEIIDKNNNKLSITYMGENIETLTTFSNYKLFFTYTDGKITEIKDELGRTVLYKYDGDYLTEVTHVDKGTTKYIYDEKGYISNVIDANGNTYIKNFFDKKGRVIRQEYPNGDFAVAEYNEGERENTFYYNESKRTEKTRYNNENLITCNIYEDGSTEEYKYDDYQNKIYIKGRNGFETHKVYNKFGNLLKEILPNGLTTEYSYDDNGYLVQEKDSQEKEIIYGYDNKGNLTEKKTKISVGNWITESYTYDSYGRILSKTDGNGNTSKYEYANASSLEGKQGKDPVRVITNSGYVYEYSYDNVGRNTEIKTDYGTIEFAYNHLNYAAKIKDANGNVTIKNYDNMGNLTSLYTPNACINGNFADEGYRYTYDYLDRLVSIKNPLGTVTKSIRDSEGNIIKEVNPNYYSNENHDGIGIEYVYDKDNRKIKTIYPDGGIERLFYDSNGNVIKHISPEYYNEETDDGLGFCYTYDAMNRLSSIINEEGVVEKTFEYDLHGNIVKEVDIEGNSTLFKYDLVGNLIEKRVPVENNETEIKYNVTCYEYDKNSNKILEKHGTISVSENEVCNNYNEIYFNHDEENRLIEVKDKYGAKTKYKYDCLNKKTYESFKINDKTTKAIHYIYDKVGNLIQKKEEINGGFVAPETAGRNVWAITNYEYDKNGNITKIITPKGYEIGRVYDKADRLIEQHEKDEANGIFRSYVYKYDKTNNITSISEYSGEEAKLISSKYLSENDYGVHWSERYENRKENEKLFEKLNFKEDQKKKIYNYDAQNRLTHFVNFSGNTTRLFYDKNDRIIKQVLPEQYDKAKDDGVGTTYSYNLKGQVVEVKNALGETITKNTYDPKGNLKIRVDGENNKVEYTYTLLGQVKDIVTPNSRKENKSAQSYKYDAMGNITGITDGNGNQTSYLLDDWGRIIQITTAEGGVEKYTYDYAGNITSTTDANGGTIEYIYNSLGQVCEIRDQEGNSEYFYYDSEGNLTKHIDRNQNHVDRAYNLDRNIVSVKAYQIDEDAIALEAREAEEARLKAIEEAKKKAGERFVTSPLAQSSRRRSFTERLKDKKERQQQEEQIQKIDKADKIEVVEDPNNNKLNVVDQRFKYNPDGTLKSAYTGNMQYEYAYNIEGMLESKSASGRTLLRYTYDKNNNIKTIKDITGKSSIYRYDEVNRVKSIEDDNSNTLANYEYFKNNNIKSVTVGNGLKTDYTYDEDGNVQSLVTISPNGEVLVDYNYAYDLNGNRVQKVSSKHKNFYTYDSMNRLKEAAYDDRCESFTYDKVGNRLTKTTNDITEKYIYNVKNQLKELQKDSGTSYFTYDKQGNTIKEETATGNNIFEYNTLNQQVKDVTKDGNTLVSRYDTEGLRAEIEENEKLTKFIFHKENVLVEADKDFNVISRFTRGYEIVAADIAELGDSSKLNLNRHYHTVDEQGSTVYITDKNQQAKNEYYYDAFGNVLESEEKVHNRITYTGQQFDGVTGQYYLRARFYNPVIGRFTQEDTYRGDGLNLYAYCGNNPIRYYDPSGYSSKNKERTFESGETQTDFYVGPEGNVSKNLSAYDSYTNDWILNKGYKPQPGERTFDGYVKNNVPIDKETPLYTDSPGFNTNPKNSDGQFKRFGTDGHGPFPDVHVHQPTRNVNPKTGMINGGQGSKTKNNGVTEPTRKDIKQLYEYLENEKYHK